MSKYCIGLFFRHSVEDMTTTVAATPALYLHETERSISKNAQIWTRVKNETQQPNKKPKMCIYAVSYNSLCSNVVKDEEYHLNVKTVIIMIDTVCSLINLHVASAQDESVHLGVCGVPVSVQVGVFVVFLWVFKWVCL